MVCCVTKGAIAISPEHADIVGAFIRGDDVEYAIAVQIAQGYRAGSNTPSSKTRGIVYCGSKGAIANTKEHADIVRGAVRSDHIEYAIAVHIAQGHRAWISISSRGVVYCGTKGAIAKAHEHADIVRVFVRSDDVEYAIAVHIAQGYGGWIRPRSRGEVYCGTKGAIAKAQQHAGVRGAAICGDHIEYTIAVHITQGYRGWTSISARGEGGPRCKRRQGSNGWQAY